MGYTPSFTNTFIYMHVWKDQIYFIELLFANFY